MLKMLHNMAEYLPYLTKYTKFNKNSRFVKCTSLSLLRSYSKPTNPSTDLQIVDVNIDNMMNEDGEAANDCITEPKITSTDLNGVQLAPIDVDPWTDEELQKSGTVDMEYVEKLKEEIHYAEPPKERSGYYEFEGIKIWLPKQMLTPATYRYHWDKGDEALPDDIRICKFEKFKPS